MEALWLSWQRDVLYPVQCRRTPLGLGAESCSLRARDPGHARFPTGSFHRCTTGRSVVVYASTCTGLSTVPRHRADRPGLLGRGSPRKASIASGKKKRRHRLGGTGAARTPEDWGESDPMPPETSPASTTVPHVGASGATRVAHPARVRRGRTTDTRTNRPHRPDGHEREPPTPA